jgi:hypothetical protein
VHDETAKPVITTTINKMKIFLIIDDFVRNLKNKMEFGKDFQEELAQRIAI